MLTSDGARKRMKAVHEHCINCISLLFHRCCSSRWVLLQNSFSDDEDKLVTGGQNTFHMWYLFTSQMVNLLWNKQSTKLGVTAEPCVLCYSVTMRMEHRTSAKHIELNFTSLNFVFPQYYRYTIHVLWTEIKRVSKIVHVGAKTLLQTWD